MIENFVIGFVLGALTVVVAEWWMPVVCTIRNLTRRDEWKR